MHKTIVSVNVTIDKLVNLTYNTHSTHTCTHAYNTIFVVYTIITKVTLKLKLKKVYNI